MKRKSFGPIYIVLLIILLAVIAAFLFSRSQKPIRVDNTPSSITTAIGKCGLKVTNPAPNASVSFPLTVSGVVDNTNMDALGCSWTLFEGQAGSAELSYKDAEGWHGVSEPTPITMIGDWMTSGPVPFSFVMNFDNSGLGLAAGTSMKIIFSEENPSGLPGADSLELPIKLK